MSRRHPFSADELHRALKVIEGIPARPDAASHWSMKLYLDLSGQMNRACGKLGVVIYLARKSGSRRGRFSKTRETQLLQKAAAHEIAMGPMVDREGAMGLVSRFGRQTKAPHLQLAADVRRAIRFADELLLPNNPLAGLFSIGIGIGRIIAPITESARLTGIAQLDGPTVVPQLQGDLLNRTAQEAKRNSPPEPLRVYREHNILIGACPSRWLRLPSEAFMAGRIWAASPAALIGSTKPSQKSTWIVAGFCLDIGGSTAAGINKPWTTRIVLNELIVELARSISNSSLRGRIFLSPPAGDSVRGLALVGSTDLARKRHRWGPDFQALLRALPKQFARLPSVRNLELHLRVGLVAVRSTCGVKIAPPLTAVVNGGDVNNGLVDSWHHHFVGKATAVQAKLKKHLKDTKTPLLSRSLIVGYRKVDETIWSDCGLKAPTHWIRL